MSRKILVMAQAPRQQFDANAFNEERLCLDEQVQRVLGHSLVVHVDLDTSLGMTR